MDASASFSDGEFTQQRDKVGVGARKAALERAWLRRAYPLRDDAEC